MPSSNVLHLPARSVPRPGRTRPAFASSQDAGRTILRESVDLDDDLSLVLIGKASDSVVLRLLDGEYGYSEEIEERCREEERGGGLVGVYVVLLVGMAFVVAGGIGVIIASVVNLVIGKVL